MYKYNGNHRDPGPAKNSRSRREDAEVSSFKATAERSSYSHLILGNFDAPHASLNVISGDHFTDTNQEHKTSGRRYDKLKAHIIHFPGRSIQLPRTGKGPGGPNCVPKTEIMPTFRTGYSKTNDSNLYEAPHPHSSTKQCKRKENVQRHHRFPTTSTHQHRQRETSSRPKKISCEYRNGKNLHDISSSESESEFSFMRSEIDSCAESDTDSVFSQQRRMQSSVRKVPFFRRGDFPEFSSSYMYREIKVFERMLRRQNITQKEDILEAALVTFPQNMVTSYIASLRDEEDENYDALKNYVIKNCRTSFACHNADQFISTERSAQEIFNRAKEMLDEPREELYKYLVSTLCIQPVKDKIRTCLRYDAKLVESRVDNLVLNLQIELQQQDGSYSNSQANTQNQTYSTQMQQGAQQQKASQSQQQRSQQFQNNFQFQSNDNLTRAPFGTPSELKNYNYSNCGSTSYKHKGAFKIGNQLSQIPLKVNKVTLANPNVAAASNLISSVNVVNEAEQAQRHPIQKINLDSKNHYIISASADKLTQANVPHTDMTSQTLLQLQDCENKIFYESGEISTSSKAIKNNKKVIFSPSPHLCIPPPQLHRTDTKMGKSLQHSDEKLLGKLDTSTNTEPCITSDKITCDSVITDQQDDTAHVLLVQEIKPEIVNDKTEGLEQISSDKNLSNSCLPADSTTSSPGKYYQNERELYMFLSCMFMVLYSFYKSRCEFDFLSTFCGRPLPWPPPNIISNVFTC